MSSFVLKRNKFFKAFLTNDTFQSESVCVQGKGKCQIIHDQPTHASPLHLSRRHSSRRCVYFSMKL